MCQVEDQLKANNKRPTKHRTLFLKIGNWICTTVGPQYNTGPREWQKMFTTVTKFYCIKAHSIYFTIDGARKIFGYNKDFVKGLLNRGCTI